MTKPNSLKNHHKHHWHAHKAQINKVLSIIIEGEEEREREDMLNCYRWKRSGRHGLGGGGGAGGSRAQLSHPSSEKTKLNPLYVCLGCSYNMFSNIMINIYNISINYKLRAYKITIGSQRKITIMQRQKSKHRCGFCRHNRRRGRPSFLHLSLAGTLDSNFHVHQKQR
jgi:hypothetical protein